MDFLPLAMLVEKSSRLSSFALAVLVEALVQVALFTLGDMAVMLRFVFAQCGFFVGELGVVAVERAQVGVEVVRTAALAQLGPRARDHRQVRAALRLHTREPGASTGAAAWIDAQGGARIHRIGDCRAYLWCAAQDRPVVLKQIMADQTMAYMGYVDADSPRAAQPSHMVGNGNAGDPEFVTLHMPHSGGLLLCSDGFHEVIRQAALAAYLTTLSGLFEKHGAAYLGHWCECLVRQAKVLGTNDDVSVLVLGKSAGRMA